MTIKAVVFDIGGILEINPMTGWNEEWEARPGLQPGEIDEWLMHGWKAGSRGQLSEEEVEKSVGEILGIDREQVDALMYDLWEEYLGTLNIEMAAFFAGLRPRYQTALLSNSFVGAREREQERYHFNEMTDLIIYSHEVGIASPERSIFEITSERPGRQPEEIVFLDDIEANVAAANEFGIHAILFQNNAQAITGAQACLQTVSS